MQRLDLHWDRGRVEVQSLGGMLGPLDLVLEDGRTVSPLAVASWCEETGDPRYPSLPGLMQRLRGEWPCVPFGAPAPPEGLPAPWMPGPADWVETHFHGFASHHHWQLRQLSETAVEMQIDYPDASPVRRLTRRVAGVPGEARLECSLGIEVRRSVSLPVALHPVFSLGAARAGTRLDIPFRRGLVFPIEVEPGVSRLTPGAAFTHLESIPAGEGSLSLAHLPLPFATEELVQLLDVQSPARLVHGKEAYRAELSFDASVFRSSLLWVSNRGRSAWPWSSRFEALGIEPVAGAFDLGAAVSADPANPIAASGIPTCLHLDPERPFRTDYALSTFALST